MDAALIDDATMQLALGNQSHVVYAVRQRTALHVWIDGELYPFMVQTGAAVDSGAHSASPQVAAPMPGKVLQVLVQPGQAVAAGDGLVIVEAMKMEHRITAAAAGTVRSVHVSSGQMVDSGALLLELEYPA
ncbi:MAG: biotin/lipoyl-containing protein [Candidatus Binatia bacterium]